MSTHAKLSPSSRHRWANCPGSIREEAKYPQEPSGPAAIDGTHSHTLLEKCIKDDIDHAASLVGQTLTDHEGSFVVDEERASRVQVALDYIDKRWPELDAVVVKSETKVNPAYLVGRNDMDGTVDVQIVGKDTLELIDYKDGMNYVPAEGNEQLEQYAYGVLAEYNLPVNGEYPFKNVTMTIIQPKLAFKGLNPISSWTVSVQYLIENMGTIILQAALTDDPNAALVPGEKQCKYCRHKGCSARTSAALQASGIKFDNLNVAKDAANKDPGTMSDEQLAEIIEAAPLLRSMIEAAEAEALKRLQDGKDVKGLKLVRGRGSRAWALSEDEIADKLTKMGIPKSVVWETKIISPAKVEKAQWEVTRGGEKEVKKLSDRQLKLIQGEYIKKSEGSLSVALLSDPREAVIVNAAPLFAAVDALPSWLS